MLLRVIAIGVGYFIATMPAKVLLACAAWLFPAAIAHTLLPLLLLPVLLAFAAAGGFATAQIAERDGLRDALILGAVLLVFGCSDAFGRSIMAERSAAKEPPMWFAMAMLASGPAAIGGAWLRLQRPGRELLRLERDEDEST